MRCMICSVDKLSKEFPSEPLSEGCDHSPLYCLRCAVKATEKCPFKSCGQKVDAIRLKECEELLDYLFPVVKSSYANIADIAKSGDQIFISNVEGGRTPFPYAPDMTILTLKEEIERKMEIAINKQKLFYDDKDLEIYGETSELNTMSDYGIGKGTTVHLMILLYAIPDYLDHVIFDLSWQYPKTGRDFLDATCFIFSNSSHLGTVNYNSMDWPPDIEAIEHSGDGMDDGNKKGFHTIDVFLKKVPSNANYLFFTLSVWTNPSIAHFPNPILRFYDATNRAKDLCNTSLSHASDSEAVVMCYVKRKTSGKGWEIYESGQLSDGNANNYAPLLETVKGVIAGRFPGKTSKAKVASAPVAAMSVSSSGSSSGPRPVEIVFSFDTTGSMYGCLEEVRKQVQNVITRLLTDIPELRIAVFAHGDYCDAGKTYVTKYLDFSNNKYSLCSFVQSVEKTGGGDAPECYELVLHEVYHKLSWSLGANKSLVMIGDAEPHGKDEGQNYLHLDWKVEASKLFKDKGIRIYSVQCHSNSYPFWKDLAKLGHGKHLQLSNFKDIVDLVLAICYREAAPSKLKKFKKELKEKGMAAGMADIFSRLEGSS